jgi:5-methylcytosine-specific restriction protein B
LYIIGTMNTADRSVEALDTALRRRFVFEEMLPKLDLLELDYIVYGFKASAILERINLRIEKLIDRDHCIGHSYFIDRDEDTIIDSFYKNIIPLLQEYFFGDYGKIGLVLGKGFVRRKGEMDFSFADFDYDYKEDLMSKSVYEIIDYRIDLSSYNGFSEALALLMYNG